MSGAFYSIATAFVFTAIGRTVAALFWRRTARAAHITYGLFAIGYWLGFLGSVMEANPLGAVLYGLLAAFFTWLWWKGRRKGRGRRALRELGDKSRRRIRALVDQITPSPIPSPVGA